MERTFLVLASLLGFVGVALGAFGAHALRGRLTAERAATFETAVRYHLVHALALFVVVLVGSLRFVRPTTGPAPLLALEDGSAWPAAAAGWAFVAGIALFSGGLYAFAITGDRRFAHVAPVGGVCLLAGWALLALAVATA